MSSPKLGLPATSQATSSASMITDWQGSASTAAAIERNPHVRSIGEMQLGAPAIVLHFMNPLAAAGRLTAEDGR